MNRSLREQSIREKGTDETRGTGGGISLPTWKIIDIVKGPVRGNSNGPPVCFLPLQVGFPKVLFVVAMMVAASRLFCITQITLRIMCYPISFS